MRHGISLSKEMCPSTPQERERMIQIPYASAIGSIMYAMICTRPDLSYALSMTSIYQANPGEGHWTAVKNILKYLRRTKDVFLVYGGEEELRIKGYTDASFQTDKDDSRSQSASEAAKEAVWIKKFITGLRVILSIADAVDLYCDNNGAIAQAKEPRSHQRSKHILSRFHLIREIIDLGHVEICKVHTDDNIADPLTKPLAQQKHNRYTESLGIRYGLHTRRTLAKGDVDLRVGNGARVAALAVETYARGGYQYFVSFTDDFSRYGYIYLMRHKSKGLEKFKEIKNEVQNQHGKSIKALRSDRGGEYLSQDFDELLKDCGIVSQLTPPGTPQWNGVSERRNRTLLDMVRSMMSHTDLPTSFWGYALETAAFTLNRVPSKSVQKTPHEMWTRRRPNMSFMKIWGCKAYVKHQMSTKLELKSEKCTFVRYPKETKG
ncbi:hypothetical protein V6N11_080406 [Hibiscus sabdariffa]|uniref:Integrase catalytic domain-containing protein n=1 Tax=Hibiscus sabdariffa TaxID=183260 RepID=A0ABR2R7Y7_9ROSI